MLTARRGPACCPAVRPTCEAMALAFVRLLPRPGLRDRQGAAARERVLQRLRRPRARRPDRGGDPALDLVAGRPRGCRAAACASTAGSRPRALGLPSLLAVVGGWLPAVPGAAVSGSACPRGSAGPAPAAGGVALAGGALRARVAAWGLMACSWGWGTCWRGPLGPDRAMRLLAALATLALPLRVAGGPSPGGLRPTAGRGPGTWRWCWRSGFPTALGLSSFLLGLAALVLAVPRWLAVLDGPPAGAGGAEAVGLAAYGVLVALQPRLCLRAAGADRAAIEPARGAAGASPRPPGRAGARWCPGRRSSPGPGGAIAASTAEPELPTLVHYAGWLDKLALPFLADPAHPVRARRAGGGGGLAPARLGGAGGARWAERSPKAVPDRRAVLLARTAVVLAAAGARRPHPDRLVRIDRSAALLDRAAAGRPGRGLLPARGAAPAPRCSSGARPGWRLTMTALLLAALAAFQPEAARSRGPAAPGARRAPGCSICRSTPASRVWAARPFLHFDKRLLLDRESLPSDLWLHPASARSAARRSHAGARSRCASIRGARIDWAAYDLARLGPRPRRACRPGCPRPCPPALELVASAAGLHLLPTRRSAGRDRAPQRGLQPPPEHHRDDGVGQRGGQGDAGQPQRADQQRRSAPG